MLRISCETFGTPGCEFVAEDRKVRKLEEKFFDHLREEHPEIVAGLAAEQYREVEHRVKEAIEPSELALADHQLLPPLTQRRPRRPARASVSPGK